MIFLDDRVENFSKVLVGIPATSIDTTVLVVKLNSTGTSLGEGEATGLGLDILEFVPSLLGHMSCDKGLSRLDDGEFSRHDFVCMGLTLLRMSALIL